MSGGKLLRTIVLALLACGLAFLILFFADYFFKTDFRLWVLTLKAFDADKVLIALRYLPLFLIYYIINSVAVNCFNYNTIGGKKGFGNILILAVFNILGCAGLPGHPVRHLLQHRPSEVVCHRGTAHQRHLALSCHRLSVCDPHSQPCGV